MVFDPYAAEAEAGNSPEQQRAAGLNVGSPHGDKTYIQPVFYQVPAETGIASLLDTYAQKRDVYRSILGDTEAQRSGAQSEALFAVANFGLQLAGATGGRVGATFGEKLAQAGDKSQIFPTISAISKDYRDANQKFDLAALQAAEAERAAALKAEADVAAAAAKPQKAEYKNLISPNGKSLGTFNTGTPSGRAQLERVMAAHPGAYVGSPAAIKTPSDPSMKTLVNADGTQSLGNFNINDAAEYGQLKALMAKNPGSFLATPDPSGGSDGGTASNMRTYRLPPEVAKAKGVTPRGVVDIVANPELAKLAAAYTDEVLGTGLFTISSAPTQDPKPVILTTAIEGVGDIGDRTTIRELAQLGLPTNSVTTPGDYNPLAIPALATRYALGETSERQNLQIESALENMTAEQSVTTTNDKGVKQTIRIPGKTPSALWRRATKSRAALQENNPDITLPAYWDRLSSEERASIPRWYPSAGSTVPETGPALSPDMAGTPEVPVRITPDLNDPAFNKLLFEGGDFQNRVDTNSPVWERVPGMVDEDIKDLKEDISRVGGLGSAIPAVAIKAKEMARELGLGGGLNEKDRSFQRMRRILTNVQGRALQLITQGEGSEDRILKLVQDRLAEQVEGVKADTFTTDESTRNALAGLESLFAASMQRLATYLPELGGDPGSFEEAQITQARADLTTIRSMLADVIALRKAYDFALGVNSTGAGGQPTAAGRTQSQDLLNSFNAP